MRHGEYLASLNTYTFDENDEHCSMCGAPQWNACEDGCGARNDDEEPEDMYEPEDRFWSDVDKWKDFDFVG